MVLRDFRNDARPGAAGPEDEGILVKLIYEDLGSTQRIAFPLYQQVVDGRLSIWEIFVRRLDQVVDISKFTAEFKKSWGLSKRL